MADPSSLAATVRRLIRHTRSGVLATLQPSGEGGAPFASLVTPAAAPDLSPLLRLSRLARHTRNLAADPRCALFLAGPAHGPDPQTAPRVSLLGTAAPLPDAPALEARWLALHPYAQAYAGLADFSLWRITVTEAHLVGGFGAITRLQPADLFADPAAVAAIAAAEPAILAHCNADHADALNAIAGAANGTAGQVTGSPPQPWRLVGVDVDGCDLAHGEAVLRVDFAAPVSGPDDVRAELVRLARAAREAVRPR
ncbi:MAG TPA: DUF2470 domain-containing protein [Acetobacteraceae bacterium]|jgi:putative heme iron utilization protein|nr:DUF2470 domain-containing protein [Acetobacteraceae bacterium]